MIILCLLLAVPCLVLADWAEIFISNYNKLGLDRSVEIALAGNVTPEAIIKLVINHDEINNKATLKALYCAGVNRDEVHDAAVKLHVSEVELAKALEESIAECSSPLVLDDRDNTGILASPSRP